MKNITLNLNKNQVWTSKKPSEGEEQIVLKAFNDDENEMNETVYNIKEGANIDDVIKAIDFMINKASKALDN